MKILLSVTVIVTMCFVFFLCSNNSNFDINGIASDVKNESAKNGYDVFLTNYDECSIFQINFDDVVVELTLYNTQEYMLAAEKSLAEFTELDIQKLSNIVNTVSKRSVSENEILETISLEKYNMLKKHSTINANDELAETKIQIRYLDFWEKYVIEYRAYDELGYLCISGILR